MRAKYGQKWREEHQPKPASQKVESATNFHAPAGYDDTRDHLWNFFQSVKSRRPPVEDAVFGNNAAIAIHMANFSYFNKSAAVWDEGSRRIKG